MRPPIFFLPAAVPHVKVDVTHIRPLVRLETVARRCNYTAVDITLSLNVFFSECLFETRSKTAMRASVSKRSFKNVIPALIIHDFLRYSADVRPYNDSMTSTHRIYMFLALKSGHDSFEYYHGS